MMLSSGASKSRFCSLTRFRRPHDVSVGGRALAAHAIRAGLVDEYHLLVVPTMLGGGKRVLPSNACVRLDLLDERRFTNGMVYLRYHTRA
jgi:dihydrofolate reductase